MNHVASSLIFPFNYCPRSLVHYHIVILLNELVTTNGTFCNKDPLLCRVLCVQEVVTPICIMSYYINWGNYFLDIGYKHTNEYIQNREFHVYISIVGPDPTFYPLCGSDPPDKAGSDHEITRTKKNLFQ